jgi:drug/metabolite transporter (DMT)-like permease
MQLARNDKLRTVSPTVVGAFAAIYVLWGGTYLAIALGLHGIPPFLLMGSRAAVAGAILLAISYFWDPPRFSWSDWGRSAIGGILLFACCHGALAYAQRVVPSGLSAVMLATIPFWMVLLEKALRAEDRPDTKQLIALVPGFGGVAVITWYGGAEGSQIDPWMLLLLLGSALAWAAGSIYSKHHAADIPAIPLSGMQMLCGGTVLLTLSPLTGETSEFSLPNLSAASIASFAYLALAGGVVAVSCYNWLLDRISAPIVATYTFVNPVIAVLLGWMVLGERITLGTFAGMALVVGSLMGLVWFSYSASQQKRS